MFVNIADVPSLSLHKPPASSATVVCILREDGVLRTAKKGEEGATYVALDWLHKQRPELFGWGIRVTKRLDNVIAAQKRRLEVEKVVKCGLSSHLLEGFLREPIRQRVRSISEATNKAGLMLLDIVMQCQDSDMELPNMDQTFLYRLLTGNVEDPTIKRLVEGTFASFPPIQRYGGDYQLYAHATNTMLTNLKKSVVFAVEASSIRYIQAWCKHAPGERGKADGIIKAVNKWGIMEDLTPHAQAFVVSERKCMGEPRMVSQSWLSGNISLVLKQYRRWLCFLEDNGSKLFTITPIWDIRSHFIKLDTDALYLLMKSQKLYGGSQEEFREGIDDQFRSVFKLSGLATKKWHFSRMIETDGVSMRPFHERKVRRRNKEGP